MVSLAAVNAEANEFMLQGEGRETDMTSIEKAVSAEEGLVISITGDSRYKIKSEGKISLYSEERKKIEGLSFALQPGETKTWEFPAEKRIRYVGLGVYGKGEIKVQLQKETQDDGRAGKGPDTEKAIPEPSQSTSSPAASARFPSQLRAAEASYLGGNKLEALEKLKQAMLEIWNEVPLTIAHVRLVKDTETYIARENNIFGSGEKIHVNAQIYGYTLKKVGEAYSINIVTDVYFLQKGEILAGQQDFGTFDIVSPLPNTEFRLDLTYWLTDAPPGIYDVQTVVHDRNSGQSTEFTTQIQMQ
jgi:hypothetical protein